MANNTKRANLIAKFTAVLVAGLTIGTLVGCTPPSPTVPRARGSLGLPTGPDGKPIVRVLLSKGLVSSADVSAGRGFRIMADQMTPAPGSRGASTGSGIRRSGGVWFTGAAAFRASRVIVEPVDNRRDRCVAYNSKTYRGKLCLLPKGPDKFVVINYVQFEDYLAGVLARELFGSWHIEAYRSLAVAGRTFALYHMLKKRVSNEYDVDDTVASQVYGGLAAETEKSRRAVDSTAGWTLTAKYKGKNRIFMPQYSSCCGGYVNAAIVLRDAPPIAPLAGGQRDLHCSASSKYRWAPVRVSKSRLYELLCGKHPKVRSLGGLATIRVIQRLKHGRPVWVNLVGINGGTVRLRAEKIRLAMIFSNYAELKKLYSMNCDIVDLGSEFEFRNGRGYGHGVGMCQYGLQGKALAGWKASQIIDFYYPGADIVKLY